MNSSRNWLLIGAMLGGLAVVCGAFGAHGLESHLAKDGALDASDHRNIEVWETAARYQMYNALALLAVGLISAQRPGRAVFAAGLTMTAGTLIFSGCLYALVLTGQKWLGMIVPIGGTLQIIGWACLFIAVLKK
jgi:uncharacterized membrane protein YgdD (TMEM256/DUF423 family)